MTAHVGDARLVRSGSGSQIAFRMGNRAEVKAARDAGMGLGFMRTTLPEGSGMPLLHLHRTLDEAFEILRGTVEYRLGDRYELAHAGDAVLVPAGVPHCFRAVGAEGAELVLIVSEGWGIDMIQELSRGNLLDPAWVTSLLGRYETELLDPRPHWAPGDPLRVVGGGTDQGTAEESR